MDIKLSIVITTFRYRFEKYLKRLVTQIKNIDPDIELIICINGEHQEEFDEEYRKNILEFLVDKKNTYPIFFPQFRGLSRLWNWGIINSSNDYILLLNDDISIEDFNFINNVKNIIQHNQTSFKINSSWSHVVLKKSEVIDCNFFPDIFLGIGEEDGRMEWIYCNKYNKQHFNNIGISGIVNWVDMTHNPSNVKCIAQGKYSKLNQEYMYEKLFRVDEINGIQRGVCPAKLVVNEPLKEQYPYENFYLENRDKL